MGTRINDKKPAVSAVDSNTNITIKNFWFVDVLVVVFFLSTAVLCLYLFKQDLFQTIEARDEEPAGMIEIRNNVIQRRHADRVLWDRLFVDSPVYSGDLIRAADLSSATVYIDDNRLGLNENTLIRIEHAIGGKGLFQVELKEGNLSVSAGSESSGIMLNLMGRYVQTSSGAVLDATAGEEGITVQVNEGSAVFIEEGGTRELTEGTMIAQDANGVERVVPAAVVRRPSPNARYLKNTTEPLSVTFVWNRINLEAEDTLRLEISSDPNFVRGLITVIEDIGSQAQADFDSGVWYWRLVFEDRLLSKGQLTVADASGPELKSPVMNSVFRYQNDLPQIRFQWSERPEASQYILEINDKPDFANPHISKQLSAASYIQSDLGSGTWYWRVQPVFPSTYGGTTNYSSVASFRIEQNSDPKAPAIELPDSALAVTPVQTAPSAAASPVAATAASPAVVTAPASTPVIRNDTPAQAGGKPVAGQNYTVKRGDVLHEIARQAYGNAALWTLIAAANNIQNPNLIEIGDVYFIPVR